MVSNMNETASELKWGACMPRVGKIVGSRPGLSNQTKQYVFPASSLNTQQ